MIRPFSAIPCVSRSWDRYCDDTDDSADIERAIRTDEEICMMDIAITFDRDQFGYRILKDGDIICEVPPYCRQMADAYSDAAGTREHLAERRV